MARRSRTEKSTRQIVDEILDVMRERHPFVPMKPRPLATPLDEQRMREYRTYPS